MHSGATPPKGPVFLTQTEVSRSLSERADHPDSDEGQHQGDG